MVPRGFCATCLQTAHAEIEIEYLNHEPQIDAHRFDPEGKVTAPQEAFSTLSIRANANGEDAVGEDRMRVLERGSVPAEGLTR